MAYFYISLATDSNKTDSFIIACGWAGIHLADKIYSLSDEGTLESIDKEPYRKEYDLQSLLEIHPDLLAGDQIDESNPRRWLLVSREMGVPEDDGGSDKWYLDHLFLDQDAIPTLVEVKLKTNRDSRRKVVGQMLDYAANSIAYWPVVGKHLKNYAMIQEKIRAGRFEN